MKFLDSTIELTLKNPKAHEEKITLVMDLYDLPITKRWLDKIKENIKEKRHLNKNFCFLGWPKSHRNINFLCDRLNKHIKIINEYSSAGIWPTPYFITETYSPDTLIQNEELNQYLMNQLHHHFSCLEGPIWNNSEYMKKIPTTLEHSIGQLNYLCHEIEAYIENQKYAERFGSESLSPSLIFNYIESPIAELHEEDYELFKYTRYFGGVYLHYCQVGKRWDEAYDDRDQLAQGEEIVGLRYYSGEFNVQWGEHQAANFDEKLKLIHEWISSKGVDPNNKKLSLGFLYIGEFNRKKNFGDSSIKSIHELIFNHADIDEIKVIDERETLSCRYPYSELSPDYEGLLVREKQKFKQRMIINLLFPKDRSK